MRDIDVRHHLFEGEIARIRSADPSTLVVEELGILQGDFRVDVAVINGKLHGYEIKSKSDTLERLPAQQGSYSKVFDEMTLVVDEHHLLGAHKMIPKWWRIVSVRGTKEQPEFAEFRGGTVNPGIDPLALCQLLWKEEALAILRIRGCAKGLNSKPRSVIWETLSGAIELDDLRDLVRTCLKSREAWRVPTR